MRRLVKIGMIECVEEIDFTQVNAEGLRLQEAGYTLLPYRNDDKVNYTNGYICVSYRGVSSDE